MDEKKEIRFIEMFCGVGGFRLGLESCGGQGQARHLDKKDIRGHLSESDERQATLGFGGFLQGEESEGIQALAGTQERADGIKNFRCVWANDNDKYACQVYRKRFGGRELIEGDIRKIKTITIPDHDLITAGFPCQSFSVAGQRRGFQDLTRGTLFFEICRVIRDKRPGHILLENVKGLLSHDQGRTFAIVLLSLDELGYDVEWFIANTKYYLPQNRQRVFIYGFRR